MLYDITFKTQSIFLLMPSAKYLCGKSSLLLILFFNISSISLSAQDRPKNTISIDSSYVSPSASIDDIAWLAGHWQGEAFGGVVEELWSPPLGGSMMGAYKSTANGKVQFYELQTISEEKKTLILRLKHFHPDLKSWEEKNETVDFSLVKVTPDRVYFNGFTVERISEHEINLYVMIGPEGKEKEQKFSYKRVKNF